MGLDASAFEAAYAANADRLYATSLRIVREPAAAQDIVADAFVKAWTRPEAIDNVGAWLGTVVRNASLNAVRDERRTVPLEPNDGEEPTAGQLAYAERDPFADPAQAAAAGDSLRTVWNLIEDLPAEQRAVLVLRVGEEQPLEDVAAALGKTPNATYVLLHRARAALRRRYAERVVGRAGVPEACRAWLPDLVARAEGKPVSDAFEAHLATCPSCAQSEDEVRRMPLAWVSHPSSSRRPVWSPPSRPRWQQRGSRYRAERHRARRPLSRQTTTTGTGGLSAVVILPLIAIATVLVVGAAVLVTGTLQLPGADPTLSPKPVAVVVAPTPASTAAVGIFVATPTPSPVWSAVPANTATTSPTAVPIVRVEVPVAACASDFGGTGAEGETMPPTATIEIPVDFRSRVSAYFDGFRSHVGPSDWDCSAGVGVNASWMAISNPADAAQVVSYDMPGDIGAVWDLACPLFENARTSYEGDFGECTLAAPPREERVTRLSPTAQQFLDPAHVKGTGEGSGGRYQALGVLVYDGNFAAKSTCLMPEGQQLLCEAIVHAFVAGFK